VVKENSRFWRRLETVHVNLFFPHNVITIVPQIMRVGKRSGGLAIRVGKIKRSILK
jgi:hypothetical protein